jgi:hypothetical protein
MRAFLLLRHPLSTGKYQTLGYLDHLSHYSRAGTSIVPLSERPSPHLIYMTTGDVGIGQDVLNYAGRTPGLRTAPVAVWQSVACQLAVGVNFVQMGRGVFLNQFRFTAYPQIRLTAVPQGKPLAIRF